MAAAETIDDEDEKEALKMTSPIYRNIKKLDIVTQSR
jgi:hypothetical protein